MAPVRPNLKPSLRTRHRILTASRRLFAEHGFDAASIRAISETSGANRALIYYYFKDKEALYRAVLKDSLDPMLAIWEDPRLQAPSSAWERVSRYFEGFIRFHARNEDLRKILALEITRCGKHLRWIVRQYFSKNYGNLERIISDGMARGEFRSTDPRLTATTCIGLVVFHFVSQPIQKELDPKARLNPAELHAHIMDLLHQGLAPATNPEAQA
jgi:TetR/AcrR family transcriptional regulator